MMMLLLVVDGQTGKGAHWERGRIRSASSHKHAAATARLAATAHHDGTEHLLLLLTRHHTRLHPLTSSMNLFTYSVYQKIHSIMLINFRKNPYF